MSKIKPFSINLPQQVISKNGCWPNPFGIPTIADRIAQTIVRRLLEMRLGNDLAQRLVWLSVQQISNRGSVLDEEETLKVELGS